MMEFVCTQTPSAQLALPTGQFAPALARRFLVETVCEVHLSRVVDEAELLVSELVTNGILHGIPPVTLRLTCEPGPVLRVEVSDISRLRPRLRHPDAQEVHGRGMELVDLLSHDWGVSARGEGKVIWFTLVPAVDAAPALTA
jgi:anti-sigma regulatory factor (Ser/Thr protein kinase)